MERTNRLRPLIEHGQKLMIDAHGKEKVIREFGDTRYDIHLHKKTPYKSGGKRIEVNIRLSLNSDRPVKITDSSKNKIVLPPALEEEIIEVFEDIELRDRFIKELFEVLENYYHYIVDKDSARDILRRISSYFGLDWSDYIVQFYVKTNKRNPIRNSYKAIIADTETSQLFEIRMDFEGIFLEEVNDHRKYEMYLGGKKKM